MSAGSDRSSFRTGMTSETSSDSAAGGRAPSAAMHCPLAHGHLQVLAVRVEHDLHVGRRAASQDTPSPLAPRDGEEGQLVGDALSARQAVALELEERLQLYAPLLGARPAPKRALPAVMDDDRRGLEDEPPA